MYAIRAKQYHYWISIGLFSIKILHHKSVPRPWTLNRLNALFVTSLCFYVFWLDCCSVVYLLRPFKVSTIFPQIKGYQQQVYTDQLGHSPSVIVSHSPSHNAPGPCFKIWSDILLQDLTKSQSCEIYIQNCVIALEFDRQQCCPSACQISKWCNNLNYQSHGFEASWDLMTKRLIGYQNGGRGPIFWH